MRAVVIEEGRLVLGERPDPTPAAGEVLIRVRAAGINNADLMQAAGKYPPPPGTTRRTCRDSSAPVSWPRRASV